MFRTIPKAAVNRGMSFLTSAIGYLPDFERIYDTSITEVSFPTFGNLLKKKSDESFSTLTFDEYLNIVKVRKDLGGSIFDSKLFTEEIKLFEGLLLSRVRLLPSHQGRHVTGNYPFFMSLHKRTYLVMQQFKRLLNGVNPSRYTVELVYHPYFCEVIKRFYQEGFDGLFKLTSHNKRSPEGLPVRNFLDRQFTVNEPSPLAEYGPTGHVLKLPNEDVSFELTNAYASYNWEIFFHIPLLVATRLSQTQRFEEAQKWFHYIFDPTDTSSHPDPAKFWRVKPFFELANEPPQTLNDLLQLIALDDNDSISQVNAWRNDPFNPHLIARMRNIAYMKNVVMKYLDNLIAWGDDLFQRDTIESINEATQIYILALEILGEKPVLIEQQDTPTYTFAELNREGTIDEMSNAWLEVESLVPADLDTHSLFGEAETLRLLPYFCISPNDKLFGYWDTVADRLFKIRNCMNIEGQVRQLPLYEPPIDPALLVRARAAGLDLRTVLSSLDVGLPNYRYSYTYQKAVEFCNEVRSLGNAMLGALEKRDAEKLALLRSKHEITLLTQTSVIKKKQIEEAEETLESLYNSRKLAEERLAYYSSREFIISNEQQHLDQLGAARDMEAVAEALSIAASISHLIPDFTVGGSPTATFGGTFIGNSLRGVASSFSFVASERRHEGTKASIMGGYNRRQDDWNLQGTLAEKELEQIDKQIAAAEIRVAIAEQDLANHETQLSQAREINDYMRSKFTNQELYGWMAGQLSALHYQAYQMALDLARKAERAAQHELGLSTLDFHYVGIEQGDSQKKGLLAGGRLNYQLRSMEPAFMEKNVRRLELTKHISIAKLDPLALLQLKETGVCSVVLPEALFDVDYPGHYNRRIKSVSLTIPCIAGPYTTVSCTLTLEKHWVRVNDEVVFVPATESAPSENDYERNDAEGEIDSRFHVDYSPLNQSIATSGAQNDSGLFELNFRDERYLPFEGAGVVSSQWKLELPYELRQFDYDTISDVILHINYTAQSGSNTFKNAVIDHIKTFMRDAAKSGLYAMFSAKHDFTNAWHLFLRPADNESIHRLSLDLRNRFPNIFRASIEITKVHVFFAPKDTSIYHADTPVWENIDFGLEKIEDNASISLVSDTQPFSILLSKQPPYAEIDISNEKPGIWQLTVDGAQEMTNPLEQLWSDVEGQSFKHLKADAVEDVILVCKYKLAD